MKRGPVFYDPKGRRRRVVRSGGGVIGFIVAVISTFFVISLFGVSLTREQLTKLPLIPSAKPYVPSGIVTGKYRAQLIQMIEASRKKLRNQGVEQRIIGFYTGDDEAYTSLKNNAKNLSHLMPQWISLKSDGSGLDTSDMTQETNYASIRDICKTNSVKVEPILTNFVDSGFSPEVAHRWLATAAMRAKLVNQLVTLIKNRQFDGVNVDFEELSPSDRPAMVQLLQEIRRAFGASNLQLSFDVQASSPPDWQAKYAAPCDFIVVMAYDYHDEGGSAGAISPWSDIHSSLTASLTRVPRQKVVLGIGAYSLDWTVNQPGADTETYEEALTAAAGYLESKPPKEAINFDADSLNPYYTYEDEDDSQHAAQHVCWMQDGITAYNAWSLGRDQGVSGFSVWSLGQEDPTIWSFLDRGSSDFPSPAASLDTVQYKFSVDNVGTTQPNLSGKGTHIVGGDLLSIKSKLSKGTREVGFDPSTNLITSYHYDTYPSPYVIQHRGYKPKTVVLTFDDGPSGDFTPQILDILKRENVPATFFLIGQNAEEFPRVVKRIYDEGNEIGNHTFFHPDLSQVPQRRVLLELNATQRSIESIVGRSTTLFRAPYNADRDPTTPDQVTPVLTADALGYTTVGESADPNDWAPTIQDPGTGNYRARTPDDIVRDSIAQVIQYDKAGKSEKDAGNCLLLHDAGGPRSNTVAALPRIIEGLRARGYTFTTIAGLQGHNRDFTMPLISADDQLMITLDRVAFGGIFFILRALAYAFAFAIVTGIIRVFIIVPLALAYERRQRHAVYDPSFRPPVSVLIAAFNEERVVVRTISSILGAEYPVDEVIIVNDGSKDGTSEAVRAAFAGEPRVHLIDQENTGKAGALDAAMSLCRNDIMVTVDADTQLPPETIGLLVRRFKDPEVGAVAGNIQVGNVFNAVTTWQAIEYTTSQNMDRRAYAFLNCITVVPGAIGAWRKTAVEAVGGHQDDTLAEDMDLTWRLRRANWRQETESLAFAYTEAPETIRTFFKQRFRWAYGTLQCLVKHRKALWKHGAFGRFALPSIWLFQIIFQSIAPLVDLQILISLLGFALALFSDTSRESSPLGQSIQNLQVAGMMYAVFFLIELGAAIVAYRLERKPYASLWWLFLQRFAYRQVMYAVVIKSLHMAVRGARQGWGKLERTASVRL
jgi:cellulose synthase/poly-beta-1,6-N-acetylglucosamine synthase-like glycosyltransferase/peptidoglycan/xylan/chitin deacetylase (PgdA/CDA1 family)/spore germination protein YaaH